MDDWLIYRGTGEPHDGITRLPPAPAWRSFNGSPALSGSAPPESAADVYRARTYQPSRDEIELVNAAMYLRRPLLVEGKPGTGKSTLAYSIAYELGLGPVLRWSITSGSALRDALYVYDALGRLEAANRRNRADPAQDDPDDIGNFLTLGPLGTALLPFGRPRVLLIDEIDKASYDLPNDLLNLFETGVFEIDELRRIAKVRHRVDVLPTGDRAPVEIVDGVVTCREFPIVVLTSNQEREFPAAFLRRCVRLSIAEPDERRLGAIVVAHLGDDAATAGADIVSDFLRRRSRMTLATDQLLNAIYLTSNAAREIGPTRSRLVELVLRGLDSVAEPPP
ncbi:MULTISPECIES: MoxR family ATPase [unclassified Frankia]|uniref:AAA family ATPase n=1 Tax=unclassified Frankia TaxID=2632575 RepID=UPI002AD1DBFC|nr:MULTISPECIES: MoxR family ATPase [unclassified Frankia]